ncbi:MAG: pentapeptide repeat-containing protein [Planctomycetales bacterium]
MPLRTPQDVGFEPLAETHWQKYAYRWSFSRTDFEQADFSQMDFTQCALIECLVRNGDFRGIEGSGRHCRECSIENCNFSDSDLSRFSFRDCTFHDLHEL